MKAITSLIWGLIGIAVFWAVDHYYGSVAAIALAVMLMMFNMNYNHNTAIEKIENLRYDVDRMEEQFDEVRRA